jgi:Ser/Thr protein kinase RdoA (MazF antagonist)
MAPRESVVARVVIPADFQAAALKLAEEIAVAQHLWDGGTPTVAPTVDVPPGPYSEGDALVTLWQFVSHRPAGETDAVAAGFALAVVHGILRTYRRPSPAFTEGIDACRVLLRKEGALPALSPSDKTFLTEEHDRLRRLLNEAVGRRIAIHGDPHLGNVLITPSGPRWTDWESTCQGPPEWDLSSLPEAAWAAFPAADPHLLAVLRDLRSVCVAVWCWADPDRAPEKRAAAEFHLQRSRLPRASRL